MRTYSAEEYKKKYGEQAYKQLQVQPKKPGFGQRTKEAFKSGLEKTKQGFQEAGEGRKNPISTGIKMGAGVVEAAFSPLTATVQPVIEPTLGAGINKVADKISDIPAVQKFATSKAGEFTSRRAEDVANLTTLASAVTGPKAGGQIATKAGGAAIRSAEQVATRAGQVVSQGLKSVKPLTGDLLPKRPQIINAAISKAFRMTPGDEATISELTGRGVGEFLAENNLIRSNVKLTQKAVDDFFKENYSLVRSEIKKAGTAYKVSQIPRYREALQIIEQQIKEVPGLEKNFAKASQLRKKSVATLEDVQAVKELLDEHFSLYKKTGDVKEGVIKEGLANIRRDLKQFIENEVKQATGADIADLNNKVMSARAVNNAIKLRSTKGLTKANISLSDIGVFGGGGLLLGGPIGGVAAVFLRKLIESPSVLLRVAKYLDDLSDAKKLKIQQTLLEGKIPDEFKQFIKKKP